MNEFRGKPSKWLLKNSYGYPDFLFTILTYSLLLLAFVALTWVCFGVVAFIHAGETRATIMLKMVESMKTGCISLAGVVFGLAGSYTVRRFMKDNHYLERKKFEQELRQDQAAGGGEGGVILVQEEEDI